MSTNKYRKLFLCLMFFCIVIHNASIQCNTQVIKQVVHILSPIPHRLITDIPVFKKNTKIYYPKDFENTAYHEAGHAVVAYHLNFEIEFIEIQMLHNVCQGGRVSFLKKQLTSKEDLENYIILSLAGPVAEQEFNFLDKKRFHSLHESFMYIKSYQPFMADMHQAYQTARMLAKKYYQDDPFVTKDEIEAKTEEIIAHCYSLTIAYVHQHRKKIQLVAHDLLKKQQLTSYQFNARMKEL